MKIAAYQGRCHDGDPDANLAKTRELFSEAARQGAEFLLLPEAFLSGYGSREVVAASALALDDPRLQGLVAATAGHDVVLMVGVNEKHGAEIFNTVLVLYQGHLLGRYRKTMLTGSDYRRMGYSRNEELPIWEAKGVKFGVIICADSSYVEVALAMWWKGADLIFSPHYNFIPAAGMDDHRVRVRNNHIGTAALLGVPVVRANVVNWDREGQLGYGDTAIYDDAGRPLAEAGLFTERLITADVDLARSRARRERLRLPLAVRRQLADAMLKAPVGEF
jgi:predicted amidohydrolase